MHFSSLVLISLPFLLLTACDKPCPKGQQRYGVKCVMSLVPEAGTDADEGSNGGMDGGASNTPDDDLASCIPPRCYPCELEPCKNSGVCSETDTSFECACKVGFSGKTCGVDECVINPCEHGECIRKSDGRECNCEPGYVGDACDTNTDASLASLTVSVGSLHPAFVPNVFIYSVDLGISAPDFSLTPTAAVPDGVTISVNGLDHASGAVSGVYAMDINTSRVIVVDVTADDGSQLHYEVTVRRSLVQQAYIKKTKPVAKELLGGGHVGLLGYVGRSIALWDGLLVVGAPEADTTTPPMSDAGEAVFFGRTGREWTQVSSRFGVAQEAEFGRSLAISERWLVVSAPLDTLNRGQASEIETAGTVHVFERTYSGLSAPVVLSAPASKPDDLFGIKVAISGNLVAVSTLGKGVYVYRYDGGWTTSPIVIPAPSDDPGAFGLDIALEGNLLAVAAQERDMYAGAVFVYDLTSGIADEVGYLNYPGLQHMGTAVAISNGRIASACGLQSLESSKIVIYERVEGQWIAGTPFGPPSGLTVPDELEPRGFAANGMVFQGNRIVVGAAYENHAAGGINGDRHLGAEQHEPGAAYLFVEHTDGWRLDAYLKAGVSEQDGNFGTAVAMDGDTIAITEPGDDSGNPPNEADESAADSGAVYVFSTDCAGVPIGATVPGC